MGHLYTTHFIKKYLSDLPVYDHKILGETPILVPTTYIRKTYRHKILKEILLHKYSTVNIFVLEYINTKKKREGLSSYDDTPYKSKLGLP